MVPLQAALIALAALILAPGLLFYFDVTPKIAVILVGTAVALATQARHLPRPARRPSPFVLALTLSAVAVAISTLASTHPALSLFGSNWRRFGAIVQFAILAFTYLIYARCAGHPERTQLVLRVIAGASVLTAIYGIAQYFGVDPLLPSAVYHVGEGKWQIVRPPSTLGYVSYFAAWQTIGVFASLAAGCMETDARRKALWRIAAAIGVAAVILSGTRAALVALLAGALIWAFWVRPRATRRTLLVAAAICLGAILFYFSPPGWKLRSRTRWFIEDPAGGARLLLWRDSLAMARDRWWIGYGPETFTQEFPRYASRDLARAYPDFAFESPHNIFVDALVSQGLAGLLALVALSATAMAAAWRLRAANPPLAGAMAALVGSALVNHQFSAFTAPTALAFFTCAALSVALTSPKLERVPAGRFATIAAVAAAALFAVTAGRLLIADRLLANAQAHLRRHEIRPAAVSYSRYLRWRLPGTSADLWYARALVMLAQSEPNPVLRIQAVAQAAEAAQRATRAAEEPFNAWYTVAGLYAAQNDAPQAESALRAAIAANPHWFKPHWVLARLLAAQGRWQDARGEAALAADRNAGKDPEVTQTLAELNVRIRASAEPNK